MCCFFNQIYAFNYVPVVEKKTLYSARGQQGQGEQLLSLSPALIASPQPNHSPSACGLRLTRSILWAVPQIDSSGLSAPVALTLPCGRLFLF